MPVTDEFDVSQKYFLLSVHFSKNTASEFGLVETDDEHLCIDPVDDSVWKRTELYDFGWGDEIGYERLPHLSFKELFHLVKFSQLRDNQYGAAAVILKRYPDDLLEHCLALFQTKSVPMIYKEIAEIFKLDKAYNRSEVIGKSYEEIKTDHEKWLKLSESVKKYT